MLRRERTFSESTILEIALLVTEHIHVNETFEQVHTVPSRFI
jgi:hypothetical protein